MRLLLLVIVFFNTAIVSAKSFDIQAGYGFYEGCSIGIGYNSKQNYHSFSFSVGYDNFGKKNQENLAFTAGYKIPVFKNQTNRSGSFRWHLNNKVALWQLEDDYYLFRAVSIIPSINRSIFILRNLSLSLDAGISINFVLFNRRKTYMEVGWPYHVMPDFRILFVYAI